MKDNKFNRTLVTCALPYANGPVHIGHLSGVYVPADAYVRYLRLRGEDVLFVCGSDEHGVPITIKARKEGCTPQDIVDRYHRIIKDSFSDLGINFDIYSRTTSKVHEKISSEYFRRMYDHGDFTEHTTEQYYDPEADEFLADRYISGTCPKCGAEGAYGDQCEKCGSTLSPDELINPHSTISGAAPVKKATSHWYLPLQKYESWLREWILEGHKEWRSNVYGQCKSWLDGGLQPRAVTRDLKWGVNVPVEGAEGKVLYVWFDAPIGYISNTVELLPQSWQKWWKSKDTRLIHFIGKDNIVFHCIVFPSMLKADGSFILPDNVPSNEFLNLEGDKISTSRGWAVWAHEFVKDFPTGQDVLRYVLTANAPEAKDNDFSWKDFLSRNNNELVAIFGNFVNRAIVLTHKYFGGIVPAYTKADPADSQALGQIAPLKEAMEKAFESFKFREALSQAMNIARVGNRYLTETEPWVVSKTDMERTGSILNVALQICADLAVAFEPFTPFAAEKLREMLCVCLDAGFDHRSGEAVTENTYREGEGKALHTRSLETPAPDASACGVVLSWDSIARDDIIPAGHKLGKASLLFSKIEDAAIQAQTDRLEQIRAQRIADEKAKLAKVVSPQKEAVSFDDFSRMDIRTATVLEAVKVPKTDKLLKLTVDTGIDRRTIVSGIAEFYSPEQMVGRQICVLVNLAPRMIRGIESRGMILMARQGDGTMRLVTPSEAIANGAEIG